QRRPASACHHPGRRRPGQPGLYPAQGQRQHRNRLEGDAGDLPGGPARVTAARAHPGAQRGPGRPRHPGAAAAAQADGQRQGDRDDLARQGRRRLPCGECRRAGHRTAGVLAVHAVRLHEDAGEHRLRPARQARGGDRAQQHRGQADGADAAAEERHRHRLPQRHPGPQVPHPASGCGRGRGGQAQRAHGRHGQARRRGRRRWHEPQRAGQALRRCGLRRRAAGCGLDHAGAGRRRPDDQGHVARQHAAGSRARGRL
ncbi:MAG: Methenyltetrahydrofolate cyclohydrolase / Methylenetetrahydrofolate dehydrogenase (NADP+), partial [uncultured Ramlibacter sp.]